MSISQQDVVAKNLHLWTLKNESNPKTKAYWAWVHNGMVVLNPEIVSTQIENAKTKIDEAKKAWKNILVISEKSIYRNEIEANAAKWGYHYLNYRVPSWVLTNFDTLLQNISQMNKLREFVGSDAFNAITKKERLMKQRQLEKLERTYKGVTGLYKKPDLVVIVDWMYKPKFIDEVILSWIPSVIITSTSLNRYLSSDQVIVSNMYSYEAIDTIIKTIFSI